MRRLHSGTCSTQPQTDAGASADSRRWYRSTDSREFTQTIQESARICVNLRTGTLCENRRNTDPQIHANSRRLFKNLRESASICRPVRSARIGGTPIHRFTRIHADYSRICENLRQSADRYALRESAEHRSTDSREFTQAGKSQACSADSRRLAFDSVYRQMRRECRSTGIGRGTTEAGAPAFTDWSQVSRATDGRNARANAT